MLSQLTWSLPPHSHTGTKPVSGHRPLARAALCRIKPGRYDLPLGCAMLASAEADSLRGSFRPHLPWTRNNRNHRPGKSIPSLSDASKSPMETAHIGAFSHHFPIRFANYGETGTMQTGSACIYRANESRCTAATERRSRWGPLKIPLHSWAWRLPRPSGQQGASYAICPANCYAAGAEGAYPTWTSCRPAPPAARLGAVAYAANATTKRFPCVG